MYRGKRLFDLFFSLSVLITIMPILIIISLLILIVDGRPIFFIQKRVGKSKLLFNFIKFRTMTNKNDIHNNEIDFSPNSRITRLGYFLRKYKLDELPQFINVLRGHMSVVGPRPEVESMVNLYPDQWQFLNTCKPGITDMVSIEYRNEIMILNNSLNPKDTYEKKILRKKLDLYLSYNDKKNSSFINDIYIILRTIKVIII